MGAANDGARDRSVASCCHLVPKLRSSFFGYNRSVSRGAYGPEFQRALGLGTPELFAHSRTDAECLRQRCAEHDNRNRDTCRTSPYSRWVFQFFTSSSLLSLFAQPIFGSHANAEDPIVARLQLLETSNLWLASLQSLVVAAIGVLFFLEEGEKRQAETRGE